MLEGESPPSQTRPYNWNEQKYLRKEEEMNNKGLETFYEWQINGLDKDGNHEDLICHLEINDIKSVIAEIKDGHHVEILKRRGSDAWGEVSRDYFELDESNDLPKYIQKYVNKVREQL